MKRSFDDDESSFNQQIPSSQPQLPKVARLSSRIARLLNEPINVNQQVSSPSNDVYLRLYDLNLVLNEHNQPKFNIFDSSLSTRESTTSQQDGVDTIANNEESILLNIDELMNLDENFIF